ncbi:aspartyl/glutamyl-tRNA amidotransferase subunit C [Acidobacteriota bacterium]
MAFELDLDHICFLANLRLPENERIKLRAQMLQIVEWIDDLKQCDDDTGDEGNFSPTHPLHHVREDEILPSSKREQILSAAPEKDRDFFIVPRVIKKK